MSKLFPAERRRPDLVVPLDLLDQRVGGSFPQQLLQLRDRLGVATADHFDPPVGQIPGEPRHSQRPGVPRHEPSEPDALHHARSPETGWSRRLAPPRPERLMAIGITEIAMMARMTSVKFSRTTGMLPKK